MEPETEKPGSVETGYLIIRTSYRNDSTKGGQDEINANGVIASRVWAIIDQRQSDDSPIRGAVVETVRDTETEFYVVISVRATEADWGPDPLNAVARAIEAELPEWIEVESSVKVDKVEVAKERKPATPTRLQGLP